MGAFSLDEPDEFILREARAAPVERGPSLLAAFLRPEFTAHGTWFKILVLFLFLYQSGGAFDAASVRSPGCKVLPGAWHSGWPLAILCTLPPAGITLSCTGKK